MNHDLKRLEAVAHRHIPQILLLGSLRLERVEDAGSGEQHAQGHFGAPARFSERGREGLPNLAALLSLFPPSPLIFPFH